MWGILAHWAGIGNLPSQLQSGILLTISNKALLHPRYRNLETDSIPTDLAVETEVNSYNYRYMYFPGDSKRYPNKMFYQSEASTAAMGPNFYEMNRDKVVGLAYWGVSDISLQPKPLHGFCIDYFACW